MRVKCSCCVLALVVTVCSPAQETPGGPGVRNLFYAGTAPRETLPAIRKTAPASAPLRPQGGARNLGLRYNLVLVDQKSGRSQNVGSTRNFVSGECFAIDIEANRSGYLYVLAQKSSGDWMPLFPSARMVNQSNVINPGQKVRAPPAYCFEITDPPGTQKLFVALARDPREVSDLHVGIGGATAESAPARPSGALLITDTRLVNNAVARMSTAAITRDIVIREVRQPADSGEPPNSVYVVNTSAKPASKVVAEVLVHHR